MWSSESDRNSETRAANVAKDDDPIGRLPVGEMTATACTQNPVNSSNGMATIASHRARFDMLADNAHLPKADEQDRDARGDGRDDPEGRQRRHHALAEHLVRDQAGDDESDHLESRIEAGKWPDDELDCDGQRHRREHRDRESPSPE